MLWKAYSFPKIKSFITWQQENLYVYQLKLTENMKFAIIQYKLNFVVDRIVFKLNYFTHCCKE